MDGYYRQGYNLMSSPAAQRAFDIHCEPDAMRDRLGRTSFGQRALLARRLVEAGVPFVTLYDGGWDHHSDIFRGIAKKLPPFENAIATLIERSRRAWHARYDLGGGPRRVRPYAEDFHYPRPDDSWRDHWANAMSIMFAGAGTPGGQVIGATDRNGYAATERICPPRISSQRSIGNWASIRIRSDQTPNGRPVHLVSDPTPISESMG